ncbi:hypothetical protein DFR67_101376 [Williamsia limnetica]|jgi:hypothetical protein|uniref:Uncharacterized protein n=1 Tax=Williamsia limnetica TaxID=882452 RepID=A0A318S881_WILLI|nr:hypothetical protein [Williamsia limnetica]PYE20984.1 hypothetical protein DFR67_101376 [Williamsia limnetica]
MRRTVHTIDRLVVAVAGLALIAGGVVAVLWWQGVAVVVDAVARVDNTAIDTAPDQSWWAWALLAATVILALAGVWLLAANLRPNRVRTVSVGADSVVVGGTCAVSVSDVGKAAAKSLERHRRIQSTRTRSYVEGSTPILELTVTADPTADGRDLIEVLRAVRHQLQLSFAGSDVEVQMLLHRGVNK